MIPEVIKRLSVLSRDELNAVVISSCLVPNIKRIAVVRIDRVRLEHRA